MKSTSSVHRTVSLPPCLPSTGAPWLELSSVPPPLDPPLSSSPPHAATPSERASRAERRRAHMDLRMKRPFVCLELNREREATVSVRLGALGVERVLEPVANEVEG